MSDQCKLLCLQTGVASRQRTGSDPRQCHEHMSKDLEMPRVVAVRLNAKHCRANGDSEHMPLFTVSTQSRPTGSRVATAGIGPAN